MILNWAQCVTLTWGTHQLLLFLYYTLNIVAIVGLINLYLNLPSD